MFGTTLTAAFAAMLAVSASAAVAQTAAPPAGQVRFSEMSGAPVYDSHNRKVGPIEDVVFERSGRVAAVVLDVGSFLGIGGKHVAVSLHELRITTDDSGKARFQVDLTKDQLKSAQAFELNPSDASIGSATAPAGPPRIESGN